MTLEDLTDDQLDVYLNVFDFINESLCRGILDFSFPKYVEDNNILGLIAEKFIGAQWIIDTFYSGDKTLIWRFKSGLVSQ